MNEPSLVLGRVSMERTWARTVRERMVRRKRRATADAHLLKALRERRSLECLEATVGAGEIF